MQHTYSTRTEAVAAMIEPLFLGELETTTDQETALAAELVHQWVGPNGDVHYYVGAEIAAVDYDSLARQIAEYGDDSSHYWTTVERILKNA